jgi:CheY-like chemotaxis protein
LGLTITITTFQKSTVNQIKANINFPEDKYRLIIIFDDEDFNGFEAASAIWENSLSGNVVILLISANDQKGNYLKCITLGVDHYFIKPFEINDVIVALKSNFPYLEASGSPADFEKIRTDVEILIIEDNIMNQKVIKTLLTSLGYSSDVADDGYSGFLQAKTKKYDLIFMDLVMPEMDGFEASRKILEYDKSVLIVAFTADNLPETRRKAELSGIKDFISKPVRVEELRKLFTKYYKK